MIRKLNIWVIVILCSGILFSKSQNLMLCLVFAMWSLVKRHGKCSFNMPQKNIYILLIVWALIVGLVNYFRLNSDLYVILKHTYYCSNIFIFWFFGEQLVRTGAANRSEFLYTSAITAGAFCTIDIISSLYLVVKNGFLDINSYRMMIGTGSFLSVLGIFVVIFFKEEIPMSKSHQYLILFVCMISILIHLSRMSILYCAILLLYSGIEVKNQKTVKMTIFAIGVITFLGLAFPNIVEMFMQKILGSFEEINFRNKIWDEVAINNNWRGYEIFCALKKLDTYSHFEFFLGRGFGTTLEVGNYAHLVTEENSLSFLHNGYFTQLLIWGIIGVFLFLYWIFDIYQSTKKYSNKQDMRFVKGLLVITAVANYFVMGPFFSRDIASLFFIISFISNTNRKKLIN